MKEEFDIQMNVKSLYSYFLYHNYSKPIGLLGTCVGLLFLLLFTSDRNPMLLAAGLILIAYLPVSLHTQAARQFLNNPVMKEPIHYCLDEEGITVSQNEAVQNIEWSYVTKAVSSPSAIIVYTGKNNACILPKKQLGERLSAIVQMISTHVEPKKVKIRGNL